MTNLKRVISLVLLVVLVSSMTLNYSYAEGSNTNRSGILYGDLNGEGTQDDIVDSADYTIFRKYLIGNIKELPGKNALIQADLNLDGSVDSADYSILRKYLTGKITSLPYVEVKASRTLKMDCLAAGAKKSTYLMGDGTLMQIGKANEMVSSLSKVKKIDSGYSHFLALKEDGTVATWGDFCEVSNQTPEEVKGLPGIAAIAAGSNHNLVLTDNGTLLAWGDNGYGQLGNNVKIPNMDPIDVQGISEITAISAGEMHSLALKKDGRVFAWGTNEQGQLGAGVISDYNYLPTDIKLTDITSISCGYNHNLALKKDGTVVSWGANESGQLGDGTLVNNAVPSVIKGLTNIVGISAGSSHSIALKDDGTLYAWGSGRSIGKTQNISLPVKVDGIDDVISVSAGSEFNLAMKSDGTLWSWGRNNNGQLGDGTTIDSLTPKKIIGDCNETLLKSICIDGTLIEGFSQEKTDYTYYLSGNAARIPNITADAWEESQQANVIVNQAKSMNGTATINIYLQDGSVKKTYTIKFVKGSELTPTIESITYVDPPFAPNVEEKIKITLKNDNTAEARNYYVKATCSWNGNTWYDWKGENITIEPGITNISFELARVLYKWGTLNIKVQVFDVEGGIVLAEKDGFGPVNVGEAIDNPKLQQGLEYLGISEKNGCDLNAYLDLFNERPSLFRGDANNKIALLRNIYISMINKFDDPNNKLDMKEGISSLGWSEDHYDLRMDAAQRAIGNICGYRGALYMDMAVWSNLARIIENIQEFKKFGWFKGEFYDQLALLYLEKIGVDNSNSFWTKDTKELIKTYITEKVVDPTEAFKDQNLMANTDLYYENVFLFQRILRGLGCQIRDTQYKNGHYNNWATIASIKALQEVCNCQPKYSVTYSDWKEFVKYFEMFSNQTDPAAINELRNDMFSRQGKYIAKEVNQRLKLDASQPVSNSDNTISLQASCEDAESITFEIYRAGSLVCSSDPLTNFKNAEYKTPVLDDGTYQIRAIASQWVEDVKYGQPIDIGEVIIRTPDEIFGPMPPDEEPKEITGVRVFVGDTEISGAVLKNGVAKIALNPGMYDFSRGLSLAFDRPEQINGRLYAKIYPTNYDGEDRTVIFDITDQDNITYYTREEYNNGIVHQAELVKRSYYDNIWPTIMVNIDDFMKYSFNNKNVYKIKNSQNELVYYMPQFVNPEEAQKDLDHFFGSFFSITVSFIPGVGTAKDISDLYYGYDIFTGDKLSNADKGITAGGVIISIVPGGKQAIKGITKLDDAIEKARLHKWDKVLVCLEKAKAVSNKIDNIKTCLKTKKDALFETVVETKELDNSILYKLKDGDQVEIPKSELTKEEIICSTTGCFTGDTLVTTKDGLKRIDKVKEGEYVYAKNVYTGEVGFKPVLKVHLKNTKEFIYLYVGNDIIKTTPYHLFFTDCGWWKAAENIKAGDRIVTADNELKEVTQVRSQTFEESKKIYNLNVDGFHTYFVGTQGLLVHNDCTVDMMAAGREALEKAKAKGINDPEQLSILSTDAANYIGKKIVKALDELVSLPGFKKMKKSTIEEILTNRGYSSVAATIGEGKVWTKALPDGNTMIVRVDNAMIRPEPLGWADEVPHVHKEILPSHKVVNGNFDPYDQEVKDLIKKYSDSCELSTENELIHTEIDWD